MQQRKQIVSCKVELETSNTTTNDKKIKKQFKFLNNNCCQQKQKRIPFFDMSNLELRVALRLSPPVTPIKIANQTKTKDKDKSDDENLNWRATEADDSDSTSDFEQQVFAKITCNDDDIYLQGPGKFSCHSNNNSDNKSNTIDEKSCQIGGKTVICLQTQQQLEQMQLLGSQLREIANLFDNQLKEAKRRKGKQ